MSSGPTLSIYTDQEIETQRGQGTCLKLHSKSVAETGPDAAILTPGPVLFPLPQVCVWEFLGIHMN